MSTPSYEKSFSATNVLLNIRVRKNIFMILYSVAAPGLCSRYSDVPGFEPRWGDIFPARPGRPHGPRSPLYNGHGVCFTG